jgi:hypothetical protein
MISDLELNAETWYEDSSFVLELIYVVNFVIRNIVLTFLVLLTFFLMKTVEYRCQY